MNAALRFLVTDLTDASAIRDAHGVATTRATSAAPTATAATR
jgi:hypothetical protein